MLSAIDADIVVVMCSFHCQQASAFYYAVAATGRSPFSTPHRFLPPPPAFFFSPFPQGVSPERAMDLGESPRGATRSSLLRASIAFRLDRRTVLLILRLSLDIPVAPEPRRIRKADSTPINRIYRNSCKKSRRYEISPAHTLYKNKNTTTPFNIIIIKSPQLSSM